MEADISPVPTEEEAAAIAAAVEALWPRPVISADDQNPLRAPTWRFSNRWWARPLPIRRDRPYR